MQTKKLLILGANPETAGLVKKANDMGVVTYVTDYNAHAYAKKYARVPCNIDATNLEELINLITRESIDGVLAGVAESLLPTYEKICSILGLPCFGTKKQFELLVNKERFKDACRKHDVPVVDEYCLSGDYSDEEMSRIRFPVIVKPVDSCSSKGISVCYAPDELKLGMNKALMFSQSKKVIVEKYMSGQEVVIYYAFQCGEPSLLAMCDRYTNNEQKGVAQLPTSYVFPSRYLAKYMGETDGKVKDMFRDLGLKNGFMFIQSFIDEDGRTKFYEPGYRLNGAQEHYIVAETTGIDAKECLIRFALSGEEASYRIASRADPYLGGKFGCKLSPLIKEGRIGKIIGLDDVGKMEGVISVNPSYDEGALVTGMGTLKQIVCRFFIVANTKHDLKRIIDDIYMKFNVYDENGRSMLLERFNTSVMDAYE